jgi:hypothetical protein
VRKIELVWDDAQWGPGIGETKVEELLAALEANESARPDAVYLIREGDRVYPDSRMDLEWQRRTLEAIK